MSDIIEGMGTIAEGSLFARVLDPGSGAKERHPGDPDECLNCGAALSGAFCQACGQSGHVHRTIGAFMHDLLHGALHFEGRLWRTLPMLLVKPGQLTRRYVDGERARFVSPMALFLFSVFLMFASFQILGLTSPQSAPQDLPLEVVRAPDGEADSGEADSGEADSGETISGEAPTLVLPDDSEWQSGYAMLDNGILKKWRENPELMLYKLQANAYKFSWLLIPLSVPFVWVLFAWRRRFNAYDHAIFVTYSLSFMTLLFVALSLLDSLGVHPALLVLAGLLLPPVHLYKQLRHAYALSRLSAFWRLLALSAFIWVVALLFVQLLLMIGGM